MSGENQTAGKLSNIRCSVKEDVEKKVSPESHKEH